ncbi:CBN-TLK-1 protein [Caenorhabditis brenneri]|uniref:CBN-TLK-1 protein n=1 Tax=Caenorhabditis brenneri TaxID=135651 RepID=G0MK88_CAEBE|nr:CBN-TLK-1 protein [Caenorhabditis brenneri]
MSMEGAVTGGGGGERNMGLEQKIFNTGPQNKALPTVQSNGSSSNHAPIVGEHQLGISSNTMATGDTGHVANVAYMSSGMLGATQFMPQNASHPSTSVMMQQQPQNGGVSRSSPTEMQQCMQTMSDDSIEMRDYNSGMHHMHPHQMQMQHHMQPQQQYSMPYHNHQQMHYHPQQQHQQYQQQQQHHQMYAPQIQQQQQPPQQQQQPLQQSQQQTGQTQQSSSALQHINESSNLSSAGSISDREPEQQQHNGTPQRPTSSQTASTADKKSAARKRRRVVPNDDQATPKQERKITEFMKVGEGSSGNSVARCLMTEYQQNQGSPKRQPPAQQNGSNNYDSSQPQQSQQMNQHEIPHSYWAMTTPSLGANNRGTPTPTQQQHYSSDSNSNSNQSPPGQSNQAGRMVRTIDGETQTDASLSQRLQNNSQSVDEVAKRDRIIDDYRRQLDDMQTKHNVERRKNEASKETIKRLLIEKNIIERKALRDKTAADSPRIGCFKTTRTADSFRDQWVDGWAFAEIDKKNDQITAERNEIVAASALLKKRKPLGIGKEPKRPQAMNSQNDSNGMQPSTSNNANGDDAIFRRPEEPKEIQYQEYIELDEIYKLRREHLRKEETDLGLERERLDRERQYHMRELKRVANESASQFKDHPLLHKRYLMLNLLGKGGFSEVWKAFDMEENRYVACKIHHVNKEWKEEKKANYVKHAMREKDIHKSLDHCRIVKQYDLLTIDNHSFCTVLEYVPGNDLDFYLKQNKSISEKEARSIIMQVVSALVYLNEKSTPIIHYDLKPANILLESGNTSGAIKITDFGLSKIMEGENDDHDLGIELTSQFAGTYWYLPPETFIVPPPKITCKVDVWSIGVIFYQCIYGKKPFGNDLTQQKILEYNTIINAREVSFPSKPQVSSAAQDFIRRCLQYRKEDRADVFELARHELFKPRGSVRASIAGSISSPSIPRSPSVNREDDNI